jgi:hypothetical protein
MAAEFAGRHVFDHALTQRRHRTFALDVHRKLLVSIEAKSPRPTRQLPPPPNARSAVDQPKSMLCPKHIAERFSGVPSMFGS